MSPTPERKPAQSLESFMALLKRVNPLDVSSIPKFSESSSQEEIKAGLKALCDKAYASGLPTESLYGNELALCAIAKIAEHNSWNEVEDLLQKLEKFDLKYKNVISVGTKASPYWSVAIRVSEDFGLIPIYSVPKDESFASFNIGNHIDEIGRLANSEDAYRLLRDKITDFLKKTASWDFESNRQDKFKRFSISDDGTVSFYLPPQSDR